MTAPTIEEVKSLMAALRVCTHSDASWNWQVSLVCQAIDAYAAAQVRERTEECMKVCDVLIKRDPADHRCCVETLIDGLEQYKDEIRAKFLADAPGDTLADQIAQAKADRATRPQWMRDASEMRAAVPPKPDDGREEG